MFRFDKFAILLTALSIIILSSCGAEYDSGNQIIVSVRDQKMLVFKDNKPVKSYPISTSRFGLGSRSGTYHTPLGKLEIAKKIGSGAPSGAVFKSRRLTGETVRPNSPGRDPIVTRILWLRGKEWHNRNSMARCIYIHGTPAEKQIGHPSSYGCIRMKSKHIIDLYHRVGVGAGVNIIRGSLDETVAGRAYYATFGARLRATATGW